MLLQLLLYILGGESSGEMRDSFKSFFSSENVNPAFLCAEKRRIKRASALLAGAEMLLL